MLRPDLVLYHQGKPFCVVEAKGRKIPDSFRMPVLEQLEAMTRTHQCEWAVLGDPTNVLVFHSPRLNEPIATFLTKDVMRFVGLPYSTQIGERIILLAIERWLRSLHRSRKFRDSNGDLKKLANLAAAVDEVVMEPVG